jgi:hypothetical protein
MSLGTPVEVSRAASGDPEVRCLNRTDLRSGSPGLFKENLLQQVIDLNPDVLPLKDFLPAAGRVCSLGREIPVELGARPGERQGFIDNLLVTDDGHLVLVETKLWRNPEAVRPVIAQVMEYSMALGALGLEELEHAIRQGDPISRRLGASESVAKRMRSEGALRGGAALMDDFEDAFARFRQTGELLVLIVADGIQTSVERLTRWLGNQLAPGSPIRLGLVELRFYELKDGYLVVPVTLLHTRELSRHTVVVEVRDAPASSVDVSVHAIAPGMTPITKKFARPDAPLTKQTFLALARSALSADQLSTVERIVSGLDALGLAIRGTPTSWVYGVQDGTSVLGLVMLGDRYLWCQVPARLRAVLGGDRFVECKRILNAVAPFYRPEDVDDPSRVNALTPKYDVVMGKEQDFVRAIAAIAEMGSKALGEQT